VSFEGSDLSDATLEHTVFEGVNFTNMEGADIHGGNLENAFFREAFLNGASFKETTIRGADFRHAQLQGADLSGLDLTGADFTLTNLKDADFRNSRLECHRIEGGRTNSSSPGGERRQEQPDLILRPTRSVSAGGAMMAPCSSR
jgi:uncharacterized protein YjbI with pentapeptide repeats